MADDEKRMNQLLSKLTATCGSVLMKAVFFALIFRVISVHLFEFNGDDVIGGATLAYPTAVTRRQTESGRKK